MLQQIRWTMIYITLIATLIHELTNGKWILILILVNKHRMSYLAVKQMLLLIFILFSMTTQWNSTQRHLGMLVDYKLNFHGNFEKILNKVNKIIGLLQKLQSTLPGPSLLTIYWDNTSWLWQYYIWSSI